jgi:hypothetical protein
MNIETERRIVRRPEGFNVEPVGPPSLPPHRQKCCIRFEADTTVTLILGMRDSGWADASSYFASLLVARLGIPFKRVRLYYTGEHPAVRRTPKPSSRVLSCADLGIPNARIGDLIEELCDCAIEEGRAFLLFNQRPPRRY